MKRRYLRESGIGQDKAIKIFTELGGNKSMKTIGAKEVTYEDDGSVLIVFRMKSDNKANCCHIKINNENLNDLTMVFGTYIKDGNYKTIELFDELYIDELIETFESATGLFLGW